MDYKHDLDQKIYNSIRCPRGHHVLRCTRHLPSAARFIPTYGSMPPSFGSEPKHRPVPLLRQDYGQSHQQPLFLDGSDQPIAASCRYHKASFNSPPTRHGRLTSATFRCRHHKVCSNTATLISAAITFGRNERQLAATLLDNARLSPAATLSSTAQ